LHLIKNYVCMPIIIYIYYDSYNFFLRRFRFYEERMYWFYNMYLCSFLYDFTRFIVEKNDSIFNFEGDFWYKNWIYLVLFVSINGILPVLFGNNIRENIKKNLVKSGIFTEIAVKRSDFCFLRMRMVCKYIT